MDIQAEKNQLAKLILETDDPSIIESVYRIFQKAEPAEFWEYYSLAYSPFLTP